MSYSDSVGIKVKIGDEVSIDGSKGWIIKFIEDHTLATEVFLEHKITYRTKIVLLHDVKKI